MGGAAFASVALSACGGGGSKSGSSTGATVASPSVTPQAKHSLAEASRFLSQATPGTTRREIEVVAKDGIEDWLNKQLAIPRQSQNFDWLVSKGYHAEDQMFALAHWERPLWKGLLTGRDKLRQRITLALLDIFVVGIRPLNPYWRSFAMANYFDILADHCFGNFRRLLEEISFSTAMGSYLTFLNSSKADSKGRKPDENFARELMQLFSIGTYLLNDDGSAKASSAGTTIPTYSQTDISELARVFTGMRSSGAREDFRQHRHRLRIDPAYNDTGSVNFLGNTISGGGEQAVSAAIDTVFSHANVGPFLATRLIQSLTTSNPSSGYVSRVARVFANNGKGERGDLAAVIRAVLLDGEVRSGPVRGGGRLRDPVQRFTNWGHAFRVDDEKDEWSMPMLVGSLGKEPGWSPTVFNFHESDYSPPRTRISERGLVAPEFQILSEQTAMQHINFTAKAVRGWLGYYGLAPDRKDFAALSDDARALVDELALVLAADQISAARRDQIVQIVETATVSQKDRETWRINLATLAVMISPEYLVIE
ncbi:DUF1800 family protein [Aurantiacibacter aquimixticola]|uniref:DUF1800 family protein n=2 Tax=Aurantiacibacter aquimixticola TaxID=1958945 RepID=A0A419RTN9_9SPHN|nr:DUF1800 family protein [Aurantiacibacter aquimixticola]